MTRTALLLAALLAAASVPAASAAPSVTEAKIAGGRLVVKGKAARVNQEVVLDDLYVGLADGSKEFGFSIAGYKPVDCIVHLRFEAVDPVEVDAVVADCSRAGLTWRGPFNVNSFYSTGEVDDVSRFDL